MSSVADDLRLARAAGAGELRAQQALAGRLLVRVRATIHYLAHGRPDLDDLVQDALVEVLRSASGFRGESRLETWADRIAMRATFRMLRQSRRRERRERPTEPEQLGVRLELTGDRPDQRPELGEVRRRMAAHLQKLSPDRRKVMVLHWVLGYSVQEIAEVVEASPNTVRDRLQVGKRQLRKLVQADPALRGWAERSGQP